MNNLMNQIKRFKTVDDAMAYTALHHGIIDEAEVISLMLLSRHKHPNYNQHFSAEMGRQSPIKPDSISINQSRFERLIKSQTSDEFVKNMAECLRAIDYQCSQQSVREIVSQFVEEKNNPNMHRLHRDKMSRWQNKNFMIFCQHQPA